MSEHDILSNAIDSVSNNVDNQREGLHQALNKALEGNANMMRILSELMETSYVTKVYLSSEINPNDDGSVNVDLTIHNATSFPIGLLTGEIDFVGPEVEYFTEGSVFQAPKNVNPLKKITESIRFISVSDRPIHGKGVITLKHPHPTTGEILEHTHTFGIYVIDQLTRTNVDKSGSHKFHKKSYPVKFIRDILEIHPIKGIEIGMCTELSRKNFKIVCQIIGFSNDLSNAEIEFSSDDKETNQVVTRLTEEFDVLSG
ncbi:hypothetical protein INT47_002346 [Mucor saturninus]|uniref:Uncharacterized protein n=1 Tax=Mucor saturninus TaxID=64648 RepID=A0A8H7UUL8_9FUNG|nr:hypothetical protein INT47_002346 [Mucor saturninus]